MTTTYNIMITKFHNFSLCTSSNVNIPMAPIAASGEVDQCHLGNSIAIILSVLAVDRNVQIVLRTPPIPGRMDDGLQCPKRLKIASAHLSVQHARAQRNNGMGISAAQLTGSAVAAMQWLELKEGMGDGTVMM